MLREQERVIDHQVRALEEQDDRSEQMIRLGIAALAGGIALGSLLVRGSTAPSGRILASLAIAAVLNLASIVLVVHAYVGFRRHSEGHVGPDPGWIAEKAMDGSWTLEEHLLSLIVDHPRYSDHNMTVMNRIADRRRKGVYLLLSSLLAYAVGYFYILSEVIVV